MFEFPFLGLHGGHGRHVAEDFIFINLLFMFIPLSGRPREVWDKYLDSIVEISMGRGSLGRKGGGGGRWPERRNPLFHDSLLVSVIIWIRFQGPYMICCRKKIVWQNKCSWRLSLSSPILIQIVSNMRFQPNWHWSQTGLFKSVLTVVIIAIGAILGVKLSLIIAPHPITADQTLISGSKGGLKSKLIFSFWQIFRGSIPRKRGVKSDQIKFADGGGRYKFWAPL